MTPWGSPATRVTPRWRSAESRWWQWLAVWTTVGFGIRLGTVLAVRHLGPGGDAFYYHTEANLLVAGKGFINPLAYTYSGGHQALPTAQFPPGFVFFLAAASAVGFKSFFAHRVWCCVIGAAGIVVCGLTGREIAGRRVGLIAAFLVAVYPNLWMSDELAMSEALSPVLVAVVLLLAYRFWRRPTRWRVLWLGASIGVAALTRDELSLLALFMLAPLALAARGLSWRRRLAAVGVGWLAAAVVVAPWVGFNLSRFQKPVLISSVLGQTLATTNCDATYRGPLEGYYGCAAVVPTSPHADESVQAAADEKYGLHYISTHADRIPAVAMARLGRTFGLFHPMEQARLDSVFETGPYRWTLVGLFMYYGLLVLSVGGLLILRSRRVPVLPLLAVGLDVVVSTVIAFGTARYRITFEVSLVLLAAVQLDWLWSHFRPSPRADEAAGWEGGDRRPVAAGQMGEDGGAGG